MNNGHLQFYGNYAIVKFYQTLLQMTRRRGLQTLSRWHTTIFPRGFHMQGGSDNGLFIPPDPHFFGYIVGHERHIGQIITRCVSAGDICLDVGANIGYFTSRLAKQCGSSGYVAAFEPENSNYLTLQKNCNRLKKDRLNAVPINSAVSNKSGHLQLNLGPFSTYHSVQEIDSIEGNPQNGMSNIVSAISLDDFIDSNFKDRHIKLIKIDVEGFEVSVLRGLASTLAKKKVKYILIELSVENREKSLDILHRSGAEVRQWNGRFWSEVNDNKIDYRTDYFASWNG